MVLYPDAQKRAQEEIDSILGHGHFPHFGDADALPYLKAVLYEVLRWACPAPLGQMDPCHLFLAICSYAVDGRCVRSPSPRNRRQHVQRLLHPCGVTGLREHMVCPNVFLTPFLKKEYPSQTRIW
jgi:hypothetical protein